jgi:chromate transporter
MHRILVEEKRWISEQRFLHALNYCMLLPGPEAQQLATYVGWLLHKTRGGLVAGGLFIVPGIVAIMALSMIYAAFGNTPVITGLFIGLKAAVLAIVLEALVRIGKRALRNATLMTTAAAAFVGIYFLAIPFPLIVLGAALVGFVGASAGYQHVFMPAAHTGDNDGHLSSTALGESTPDHARASWRRAATVAAVWLSLWLLPVAIIVVTLGVDNVFSTIAVFFSKMATVTFGGAYAALAYVAQEAVQHYRWLSAGEMLDGLGMAETTPGPLIMVLQFVGFMAAFRAPGSMPPMAAGALGGLLATWVTFAPCFLWIFVGAPYIEALRGNKALSATLAAITAAVVGVILNLAVWFAVHTAFREVRTVHAGIFNFDVPVVTSANWAIIVLSAASIVAIFVLKRGMIPVLAIAALCGLALYLAGVAG